MDSALTHVIVVKVGFLQLLLKLSCDERFTHAFTAFGCVLQDIITLVGLNQGDYYENATARS
jgi:hypothetical protein